MASLQLKLLNRFRKEVLNTSFAYIARVTEPLDYEEATEFDCVLDDNYMPDFRILTPKKHIVKGTITTDDFILVDTSISYMTRIWLIKDFNYIVIPLSNNDFTQAQWYIQSIEDTNDLQDLAQKIEYILLHEAVTLEKYVRNFTDYLTNGENINIAQRIEVTQYVDNIVLLLALYIPNENLCVKQDDLKVKASIQHYYNYILSVLRENGVYLSSATLLSRIFYRPRNEKFTENLNAIYDLSYIPIEEAKEEFAYSLELDFTSRIKL